MIKLNLLFNYVGIYHGIKKPEDPNNFLHNFVEELNRFIKDGFSYKNKTYCISLHGFVCDAPAKAYILCTKSHSGYSSCSKCTIEGEWDTAVFFPVSNIETLKEYCNKKLRTDDDFKKFKYSNDYQKGKTILSDLPVGLVSRTPLDGLHLRDLGVMKQMISHWVGNNTRKSKRSKLSANQLNIISRRLENLKYVLPDDFNRRYRSLEYWRQWKATEFRHFLLYLGKYWVC